MAERFRQSVGSNPNRDRSAYVIEQDTLPFSPPRSKWVPVRAEMVVVFDNPYIRQNGSN